MQRTVLVIGSGVAGLSFALKAASFARVVLVTKKEHSESNTNYAQGGIAVVMAADDTPDLHILDTETAGAGLCHHDRVALMVEEGPARVRELIEWGARFNDDPAQARLALGREGGHSRHRIVYAQDLTGREVERTLVEAVQRDPQIEVLEHHAAVDLLLEDDSQGNRRVVGATVLDTVSGQLLEARADVTVLATGGAGRVYLHTTNPTIATGDGVAIAHRAGAVVSNMEFIQFHPTTLYHPAARSFLISEAVRGEGGILRLRDGTSFMEKYHPLASLAPRDVVARAIDQELKQSGDDFVLLDVTHLDPDFVRSRFPTIHARCLEAGLDITREPIPVVPAAHYSCGGVLTDERARTTLPGLYAVGECACTGVHGANRLASNSLLEALVFADRAAEEIESSEHPDGDRKLGVNRNGGPPDGGNEVSPVVVEQLQLLVQTLMWTHVGIVRTDRRLRQALRELEILDRAVQSLVEGSRLSLELLELRNLTSVGMLIILGSLARKESRGLHFNADYPTRDDGNWRRDTLIREGVVSMGEPLQ